MARYARAPWSRRCAPSGCDDNVHRNRWSADGPTRPWSRGEAFVNPQPRGQRLKRAGATLGALVTDRTLMKANHCDPAQQAGAGDNSRCHAGNGFRHQHHEARAAVCCTVNSALGALGARVEPLSLRGSPRSKRAIGALCAAHRASHHRARGMVRGRGTDDRSNGYPGLGQRRGGRHRVRRERRLVWGWRW